MNNGLFGYYFNGNLSLVKWMVLVNFIIIYLYGNGFCILYVVLVGVGFVVDYNELCDIVVVLGYIGLIYWVSLLLGGLVYVYFQDIDYNICVIILCVWNDVVDNVLGNKVVYVVGFDCVVVNGGVNVNMFINVSIVGLKVVYFMKL